MRKTLFILPLLGLAVATPSHSKSMVLNPQAGVIGSNLTSDASEIDDQAHWVLRGTAATLLPRLLDVG